MHRNPKKHSKYWRLSWFRYETFITFLTFKFSTRGERDTIFTMLTVPSDPTTRGAPPRPNWTRLGSNLISLLFFKIPKNPSPWLPGMVWFTSPVPFSIRSYYYDIWDCHILPARSWTPALNVCPYSCIKPKSSKPN